MLSAVSPTPRQSGDGQRAPPACGNKRRRTCCGAELFAGAPKTGRDPPEHRRGGRGRIRKQECGGRRRDRRHGARHDHALEQRSGHHPEHRGDRRKREDAMQERGLRGWQLCERAHPLSHRRRAELWKGTCPGDCTRSGHGTQDAGQEERKQHSRSNTPEAKRLRHALRRLFLRLDYSRRPQVWCPERRRGSVDQKCMCCRLHHRALPSWRRPREVRTRREGRSPSRASSSTWQPCSGRRAGTENVLLAVALGAAASLATEEQRQTAAHMRRLTARLRDGIERHLGKMAGEAPTVRVNGPSDRERCLPNTLSISIEGVSASAVVTELGDRIAFSAGSACHAGGTTMSAVLRAMHFVEERGRGTIRLSCGRHTTLEEVDRAIPILGEALLRQLQRRR
eukprot:scaffold2979_cov243-Pinguiococcus_pyrenoidosus.AAC.15